MPIFTEGREMLSMNEQDFKINKLIHTKTRLKYVPTEFKDLALSIRQDCFKTTKSMFPGQDVSTDMKPISVENAYTLEIEFPHEKTREAEQKTEKLLNKYFKNTKTRKRNDKYWWTLSKDKSCIYMAQYMFAKPPRYNFNPSAEKARKDITVAATATVGLMSVLSASDGPTALVNAIMSGYIVNGVDKYYTNDMTVNKIYVVIYCMDNDERNKSLIESGLIDPEKRVNAIRESANNDYTPENIFGMEQAGEAKPGDYYIDRDLAMSAFQEHLNMTHSTRKALIAMNEAEHNKVLTNLTSNLYDHIVKKTTDIDYGEIPKTKGDITKMSNYEDLVDCISLLRSIIKEYKQDTAPVDVLSEALANIQTRKELFDKGFRYDCELPILMYDNIVMALYTGTSYIIACCIEFIKAPKDETFTIALDKVAYVKNKDHLVYSSLDKFNKSCKSGDFDKAMGVIIEKKLKKFTGAVAAGIIAGTVVGIWLVLNIVPILRELVYLFFYTRVKISDYCETQADLLQMNAYNVEHNSTIDPEKKDEISEKQMEIANRFRKVSNFIAIDAKRTDVKANEELQHTKKKLELEELENEVDITPNSDTGSALF